jgi:hypothetical protein
MLIAVAQAFHKEQLLDWKGTAGMHSCAASMGWQHVLSLMIFMQTLVFGNCGWQMAVYEGLIRGFGVRMW